MHRKGAGDEHMLLSSKYANVPLACRMHTLFSFLTTYILLCYMSLSWLLKLNQACCCQLLISTMMKEKDIYCCWDVETIPVVHKGIHFSAWEWMNHSDSLHKQVPCIALWKNQKSSNVDVDIQSTACASVPAACIIFLHQGGKHA